MEPELKRFLERKFDEVKYLIYQLGRLDMALSQDLSDQVSALQAEDGIVISTLNDLATKASQNGSVTDADVQAAVDAIKTEVSNLSTAVTTDDPSTPPAPAQ